MSGLQSATTETTIVDKPANADEHDHGHGHHHHEIG
jgi:chaperonin GroEL